jgi:hypothetical protein
MLKIPYVSRDHCQASDTCGRSNQGIFKQIVGFSSHETRPLAEGRAIHRDYLPGGRQTVEPRLDVSSFLGILPSGSFSAGLYFSEGEGTNEKLRRWHASKPGNHSSVRPWPAQLRQDIRIKQIHLLNTGVAATNSASFGNQLLQIVETGRWRHKPILQSRSGRFFQPLPFLDRNHDCCFHAAAGHHLRTFPQGRFDQLAKTSLRVL